MLKEKGNFSKKHFGDFNKLKEFREKYNIDLATSYQTTYNFRGYADYRKFPEIEKKFDKKHLIEQINKVKELVESSMNLYKENAEFKKMIGVFNDKIKE